MSFRKFFGYFSASLAIWTAISAIFSVVFIAGFGAMIDRSNRTAAIDADESDPFDDVEI